MKTLDLFRTLGPVDLKNIRREAFLVWMLGAPLIMAVLFRFGIPALADYLFSTAAFDLRPYYPLIMSTFIMMAPVMVGMVVGFLLLDERDERVLTAMLVTPIPIRSYFVYRLAAPMAAGYVVTLVGYPVAGLVPVSAVSLVVVAALGAFGGPIIALFLASFAENKVSGFALVKVVNVVNLLPAVAYFVEMPWQLAAGLNPTYWPMKAFWLAAAGQHYAAFVLTGLAANALALALLLRRFTKVLHR